MENLRKLLLENTRESFPDVVEHIKECEDMDSLMVYLRDNFLHCATSGAICYYSMTPYLSTFNEYDMWMNKNNVTEGNVLACGTASIKAGGTARVFARDFASVSVREAVELRTYGNVVVCATNEGGKIKAGRGTVVRLFRDVFLAACEGSVIICMNGLEPTKLYEHNALVLDYKRNKKLTKEYVAKLRSDNVWKR